MSGFRLSSVAESDIASIAEFIAADNLDAAISVIDRFTEAFELLATQPLIGEKCRGRLHHVRRFSVRSYLIFYQILNDEIVIARVLHGARDWEGLV
jgi:toxin ParE1/3/4